MTNTRYSAYQPLRRQIASWCSETANPAALMGQPMTRWAAPNGEPSAAIARPGSRLLTTRLTPTMPPNLHLRVRPSARPPANTSPVSPAPAAPPVPPPASETFAVAVTNAPELAEQWLRREYPETLQAFHKVLRELRDSLTSPPGAPAVDASDWSLFSAMHPLALLRDVLAAHGDQRSTLSLKLFDTPGNQARFVRIQAQLTALTQQHIERSAAVGTILWRKLATSDLRAPMPSFYCACFADPDAADAVLTAVASGVHAMAYDSVLGQPAVTQIGMLALQDVLNDKPCDA